MPRARVPPNFSRPRRRLTPDTFGADEGCHGNFEVE